MLKVFSRAELNMHSRNKNNLYSLLFWCEHVTRGNDMKVSKSLTDCLGTIVI